MDGIPDLSKSPPKCRNGMTRQISMRGVDWHHFYNKWRGINPSTGRFCRSGGPGRFRGIVYGICFPPPPLAEPFRAP